MPPRGLDLDWEQGIFRAGRALLRRLGGVRDADDAPALDSQRTALTVFARLLSGLPLRVVPSHDAGGVRGLDLLLPARLDASLTRDEGRRHYLLRTALSATIARLGLADDDALRALPPPLPALRAARLAREALARELPGFEAQMAAAEARVLAARPDPERLRGAEAWRERARQAALRGEAPWDDARLLRALAEARDRGTGGAGVALLGERLEPAVPAAGVGDAATPQQEPERERESPRSEARAPRVGAIERVEVERDERGDIVVNPFERVETLDSHRGGSRNLDGADDLEGHLEALEEVELGRITRGGGPAQALLRADVQLDSDAPEVGTAEGETGGLPYDEWDFRAQRYRPAWCTVYPRRVEGGDPRWAREALQRQRRAIEELQHRLERLRAGLRSVDRQLEGEDVDLAALVAEHAAAAAGFGGDPRLYLRQERRRRDFATTVLLDVSLSTDAWIRGRRVLDVAREAVLVLGEVASRLGDRLRVLAFASETRNRCHVWQLLGWGEPWAAGRDRIGALRPLGYSRIGPAIRYAADDLDRIAAERKLLLLVSDAKPTDYDRYEGRYGVADVRQALRETEQRGLRAHALAVDCEAREWLPGMFGNGAWHVVPRPEQLPRVLTEVYGRLTQ